MFALKIYYKIVALYTENYPSPFLCKEVWFAPKFNKFTPRPTYLQPPPKISNFVSKNRFEALEEEVIEEVLDSNQDFHKGQTKITDTLSAIMARLTTMEEKQDVVAQKMAQFQTQNFQFQTQPAFRPAYMSPMVAPPGIITQAQWGSQNLPTQSQSQFQS